MKKDIYASNIIDNSPNRELVNVIKDQLKKSKEAKFAVGYFFLSGFSLVKDNFPENYEKIPFLKIVMGDETTNLTKDNLVEGYNLRELFKQRMIEDLQKTELTQEQIKQLETLRDFISKSIIDVKLYDKSRLHAKLYLFLTKPDENYASPGLAVVGSSNFTIEGLSKNKELNVLLSSREDVLYLNQWFDNLWEEAIEFKDDLIKVIEFSGVIPGSSYPKIGTLIDSKTLFKYLVYKWFEGRVLNLLKKDILMEFQLVGVVNAIDKINFYNGVILADSVGLGKSFVASAVIEEFLNRKHPTWIPNGKNPSVMLILPPSIITQWEELLISSGYFLKENKKNLKALNSNKIYEIYDSSGEKFLGEISFFSLGKFQNLKEEELKKIAQEYDFFVIDEAHKYRNKNTNRWKNVRKLQKKEDGFPNKFLLLTATPLNNSINDIFNLIRLFVDDTLAPFRIKGIQITELIEKYSDLKRKLQKKDDDKVKKDLKKIATEIKRKILDEVMILRTRKYIMEQFKEIKVNDKPLVFKDPKPFSLDYSPFYTKDYKSLIKVISDNINKILFEYTKLYGTRYVIFEEESSEENKTAIKLIEVADLFKLLLGKRLESGIYPFETTLRRVYEKEKIFYDLFKAEMDKILNEENLKSMIINAVQIAKIEKELDEIEDEYDIQKVEEETWFDRTKRILLEYAEEKKEKGKQYSDIELLKLGLSQVLENFENDLKSMDNIFSELNKLKQKENGGFKTLDKIPKEKDDIVDLPIYVYSQDPKLESIKQLIGNPSFKSDKLKDIPFLYKKKILIFTQYKDTAYYLYKNLQEWIKKENTLHTWLKDEKDRMKIALVTGDTDTQTKVNYMKRFAPLANSGEEEVKKFGEIDILISTDVLSEGVNLQDADAVINYDLPWNPMIIVQRVGRVNRIGNEKDVSVINYIPSDEIEIIVGILGKLKDKIRDITLIVGKDVKILSPEEEINVETFGEKIKDLSKTSMAELERYGISEDFKEFIPDEIPEEQLDEYKLLNLIQYDYGFTTKDFEEVKKMKEGPYYSYIDGKDSIVSVYEFYRGKYKIMKKIMAISKDGEIEFKTPLAFIDLIEGKERQPKKIENAIESLKHMKEKTEEIVEKLKEGYVREQKGFLYNLYNSLLVEREKAKGIENKFKKIMTALQNIPYYLYSREIKQLLTNRNFIDLNRDNVIIKDFKGIIEVLYEFFKDKGLTDIESLKVKVKHVGWYYEI